jgi:hypothetical protein
VPQNQAGLAKKHEKAQGKAQDPAAYPIPACRQDTSVFRVQLTQIIH